MLGANCSTQVQPLMQQQTDRRAAYAALESIEYKRSNRVPDDIYHLDTTAFLSRFDWSCDSPAREDAPHF